MGKTGGLEPGQTGHTDVTRIHHEKRRRWNRFPELTKDIRFDIIDYDFRDILTPLVNYIDRVNNEEYPEQPVTVVVPEFIAESLWARFLHNQTANLLRSRLRLQKDLIVIDVPYPVQPVGAEEGEVEGWRWLGLSGAKAGLIGG